MSGEQVNGVVLSVIYRHSCATRRVLSRLTVYVSGGLGRCRVAIKPEEDFQPEG